MKLKLLLVLGLLMSVACSGSSGGNGGGTDDALQSKLTQCSQIAGDLHSKIDPVTQELYSLDGDTPEYETMTTVEKNLSDLKSKIDAGPSASELLDECKAVTKDSASKLDPVREELIELDGPSTGEVKTLQSAQDQLNDISSKI